MSSGSVVDKILNNDIGKARCINCGDFWGNHGGIYCRSGSDKNKTFQPLGFALSDRCDNCGNTLANHHKRAICNGRKTVFQKGKPMFSDKEFLL